MAKAKTPALALDGLDSASLVSSLNRKYGANTLIIAKEAKGMLVSFFSTGCYAIDFATGGGIPENRITEIKGPYSSLKSTISIISGSEFQKKYSNGIVFYVDMERTFDPEYAQALGLDLKRTIVINPDSGEQAGDVMKEVMSFGKPTFVVVDSIAALTPSAELEGSNDDQFMGLHARLINRIMRTCVGALKRSLYSKDLATVTILCINQIREKIGIIYGSNESSPGGRGKDFAYSVVLRVSSSKSDNISFDVVKNGIKRTIRVGQNLKFSVPKNKVASSQFDEGEVAFYARKFKHFKANQFDNMDILFRYGLFYGLITTDASGVNTYQTISYKDHHTFKKILLQSPDLIEELYHDILVSLASDATDEDKEEETVKPKKLAKNVTKKATARC